MKKLLWLFGVAVETCIILVALCTFASKRRYTQRERYLMDRGTMDQQELA